MSLREAALVESVAAAESTAAAVALCTPLLRQESTALAAGSALLERIRAGVETEDSGIAAIMLAIRSNMAPHNAITEQVLQLLPLVASPAPLIDAIPQVTTASSTCHADALLRALHISI